MAGAYPDQGSSDVGLITAKGQQGDQSAPGPKVFEEKAQNWFATLNVSQGDLKSTSGFEKRG